MGKFTYVCDQCGAKITADGILTLSNKVKAHKHRPDAIYVHPEDVPF